MNMVRAAEAGVMPEQPAMEQSYPSELDTLALSEIVRALFDSDFYLEANPDVAADGGNALEHFLTYGLMEGRSPHPAFDPRFYAAQMPPECADCSPFLHYLRHGGHNRLDPHPLFDTAWYISQATAQTLFGVLPLLHFMDAESTRPSPNPLFDAAYYRRTNPTTRLGLRHPLLHYIQVGWRQGCRTHPLFDPGHYLALRPDVASAQVDPLAHFLHHGRHETPSTHEVFDAAHYRTAFANDPAEIAVIDRVGPIIHYVTPADRHPPSPHPLFDRIFYIHTHCAIPDENGQRDPFLRFLESGLRDHHDPHPLFDSLFYLDSYPDVAAQDCIPFLHFIRHGATEGRSPSARFDAASYLTRHPDAQGCGPGAVSHHRAQERRPQPTPPLMPLFAEETDRLLRSPTPAAATLRSGRRDGHLGASVENTAAMAGIRRLASEAPHDDRDTVDR